MKHLIWPLLILAITSCTSINQDDKIRAWEAWKGQPVSALEKHPYFRTLPVTKVKHEDGLETWVLKDQGRYQTSAYCQSLGGCLGMPTFFCDSAFSVKDHVILGLEQNGTCPALKTIEVQKK